MASVSRRAFLGGAGASGIALTTPWWGPWLRKFFGPSGHIHDMKVRTYQSVDVGTLRRVGRDWQAYHGEGEDGWQVISSDPPGEMTVSRSNGRVDLPLANFRPGIVIDGGPHWAPLWDSPKSHHIPGLPQGVYIQKVTLTQPVTSVNVARPDQKQLELKVVNRPGIDPKTLALWDSPMSLTANDPENQPLADTMARFYNWGLKQNDHT